MLISSFTEFDRFVLFFFPFSLSTGLYRVVPGCHVVSLGPNGFYWVFTGFYWVTIGFSWVLLGFYRIFRALLGITGYYWVSILGFLRGLLGFTRFYWVSIRS